MKWSVLASLLAFGACAAKEPPPPPDPPPVVAAQEPVAPAASVPPKVKEVTQDYQAAAQKEVKVVVSPDATPDSIRTVHQADIAARSALRTLERQGHHPTPAALARAREAVQRLYNALGSSGE